MRARVAAGLFERIAGASAWCRRLMCTANARGMVSPKLYMVPAEWNGFGRAMYPWACGMHADEGQQTDMATTVALMTQARLSWHAHTGGMLIKAAWSASGQYFAALLSRQAAWAFGESCLQYLQSS